MMNHVFQFRSYKEFIILSLTAHSMQSFGTKMMNCVCLTMATEHWGLFSLGQRTKCVWLDDDSGPYRALERTHSDVFVMQTWQDIELPTCVQTIDCI